MSDNVADIFGKDPFETWWPHIVALFVGFVVVIKTYMGGQQCPNTIRLDNKMAIITGGSSGIGLETAKELCRRGAHVVLGCRDVALGEAAIKKIKKLQPGAKVEVRILDLSRMQSVREFAQVIKLNYKKIDILINNAGIIFHPVEATEDGFELHMATNYLGHFLLTHLLMPQLRASDQGRVINVSAHAHVGAKMDATDTIGAPGMRTNKEEFANSKTALILMAGHMADILTDTNVTVNSLTPGLVRGTKHLRQSPVGRSFLVQISVCPWMFLLLKGPQQGAQTAIYLATDPTLSHVSGKYFNDCASVEPSATARDKSLAAILYKQSCERLGIIGL